tara:strand:- start:1179 stop:2024 length:846 start_codon:yes stop_codon:yes gene_type:complete
MSEPKPNEEYLSYERLLDDWWDTHKDDVYLREDPVAVEEDEPVVQSLAPSPQESISMDFDEEESSAIFVEEEVIEEEEPAPPSVTYGEGVSTLKQLSADVKNPDVSKRSLNAYQGALIALSKYAEDFNKYGDLYDIDPLLIASIAGYESGGNPDAVGPTDDLGLMQFTPRTWQEIMPGRSLDERLDPVLSIEAAAKLLDRERQALNSIDLAVLAYNVGVPRVGQIIRGESEFPGQSNMYWPVVSTAHEMVRGALKQELMAVSDDLIEIYTDRGLITPVDSQ